MKIEQNKEFQPITITLETVAEVDCLWRIVEPSTNSSYEEVASLAKSISSWLHHEVKL